MAAPERPIGPDVTSSQGYDLRSGLFQSPLKRQSAGGSSPKVKREAILSPLRPDSIFQAHASTATLKWSPSKDEMQCCCCEAGCDTSSCCDDCSDCDDSHGGACDMLNSNHVPKPGFGGGGGSPAAKPFVEVTSPSLRRRREARTGPSESPYNTRSSRARLYQTESTIGSPTNWVSAPPLDHPSPASEPEVKTPYWPSPNYEINEVLSLVLRNPIHEHYPKHTENSNPNTETEFKPCHCKKSKCLKLYCECFARGAYCTPQCACSGCFNAVQHGDLRELAVKGSLDRDPQAFFRSKQKDVSVVQRDSVPEKRKGCKCKKSECLKKYCECYQAGAWCGPGCKCVDCRNVPTGGCPDELLGYPGKKVKMRKRGPFLDERPEYEIPLQPELCLGSMSYSEYVRTHLRPPAPEPPPHFASFVEGAKRR